MQDLTDRVRDLAEPLVASRGLDLVEVAVKGTGPGRLVRVAVDRKGGVDLARCESVSRELERELDGLAELDSGYRLEVGSPGVDRPLIDQRDFDRVEGRRVLVHRTAGESDAATPTQLRGTVRAAETDAVVLDVDGTDVRVPYPQIVKATQSLPW